MIWFNVLKLHSKTIADSQKRYGFCTYLCKWTKLEQYFPPAPLKQLPIGFMHVCVV